AGQAIPQCDSAVSSVEVSGATPAAERQSGAVKYLPPGKGATHENALQLGRAPVRSIRSEVSPSQGIPFRQDRQSRGLRTAVKKRLVSLPCLRDDQITAPGRQILGRKLSRKSRSRNLVCGIEFPYMV